jgi:hypothetical protein
MRFVGRRGASALLWGGVGALSFLVLYGVYLLLGGPFLGVGPIATVTGAVFAGAAAASYYAERRIRLLVRRIGGDR